MSVFTNCLKRKDECRRTIFQICADRENFFMRFVRIDTVSYQLNMHKGRDEAGVLS